MPDSVITRPTGIGGPFIRASRKATSAGTTTKEPFVVKSRPWTVLRSFRYGRGAGEYPPSGLTSVTTWPFLIGLPTGTSANIALVIERLKVEFTSSGSAPATPKLELARASSPASGTNLGVAYCSTDSQMAASIADLQYGGTATKGNVYMSYIGPNVATSQYAPTLQPVLSFSPDTWMDMPVLRTGEYLGLKWEATTSSANPNANNRFILELAWDEVLL
jgi:hypothetical protein